METNWIPKPGESVRWNGKLFNVISVNLGGQCRIKGHTTTGRITKKFTVDISELTPC
jgi:hypothetical protein